MTTVIPTKIGPYMAERKPSHRVGENAYVMIPDVHAFPDAKADKAQALKPLEEAAEVFAAWQECACKCGYHIADSLPCRDCVHALGCDMRIKLLDECADLIQAACNLVSAVGIENMRGCMYACERRNEQRGRYERSDY